MVPYSSGWRSQTELVEGASPITESATVTGVRAMDADRTGDIRRIIGDCLDTHPEDEWLQRTETGADTDFEIDWTAVRALSEQDSYHAMAKAGLARVKARDERPFPSLLQVRFRPDDTFEFAPGQYVSIRYQGTPRAYSIASVPGQEEIELCIRRVTDGRLTPSLATELTEGDRITVRGPYGDDLLLQDPSERDLVFLATGTGVAPFKSMIDYTFERGRDIYDGEQRDVWLFLGAAWWDDLAYREALTDLAEEHDNFHFVPTLSRESHLSDWDGETAYVQYTLLKYLTDAAINEGLGLDPAMRAYLDEKPNDDISRRLDPRNMEVYACGVNAMVYSLADTARHIGVPERHIQVEGFG